MFNCLSYMIALLCSGEISTRTGETVGGAGAQQTEGIRRIPQGETHD